MIYRSKSYNDWTSRADQLFVMQKKGPIQMLEGPFIALLELHATGRKRKTSDADNFLKAAGDYIARVGLIENDKFMQWCLVGWVDDPALAPPYGCRLTVMEWDKKKGLPELTSLIAQFGTPVSGESEGRQ